MNEETGPGRGQTMLEDHPHTPVLVGSTLGPMLFGTMIWYHDGPVVFTADGEDGRRHLCILLHRDPGAGVSKFLVMSVTAEENAALVAEEEDVPFNGIARASLEREGDALVATVRSGDDTVVSERRIPAVEAIPLLGRDAA